MGGIEKGFGGIFDVFEMIFLDGRQGGGEDFGGGVDDLTDTGFEFERQPQENVSFAGGEIGIGGSFVQILFADKPG